MVTHVSAARTTAKSIGVGEADRLRLSLMRLRFGLTALIDGIIDLLDDVDGDADREPEEGDLEADAEAEADDPREDDCDT